jgi:hypothetical protein
MNDVYFQHNDHLWCYFAGDKPESAVNRVMHDL